MPDLTHKNSSLTRMAHTLYMARCQAAHIARDDQLNGQLLIDDAWLDKLRDAQWDSFDKLWQLPREWVEPVNERRGGWSGVTVLQLEDQTIYFKRQENQLRRSLLHLRGYPTYSHEYATYQMVAEQLAIATPPLFYSQRFADGKLQAMIATVSLSQTLVELNQLQAEMAGEQAAFRTTLEKIGVQFARMHRMGIQHGCLFSPHIWVNPASGELKLIDWERCHLRLSPSKAAIKDYRQFIRRTHWLTRPYLDDLLRTYDGDLEPARQQIVREFETNH